MTYQPGVYIPLRALFSLTVNITPYEPRREKTGFLHMRKERRRSASG